MGGSTNIYGALRRKRAISVIKIFINYFEKKQYYFSAINAFTSVKNLHGHKNLS